jgi:hypothetical protein
MKKIALVLLVLASLIVFTGCDGGEETRPGETFIGGTTGLLISFLPDFPPENVLDNGQEPFTVMVKLENGGETKVLKGDVLVTLKGINPDDFNVDLDDLSKHPEEDLLANQINPDTGQVIKSNWVTVQFDDLNYNGSLAGGGHDFPLVADVCYKYATKGTAELCVKDDLRDTLDTHVCTISGDRKLQTSGAPVQIISFEEFSSGLNSIAFTFKLKDMGNGQLSKRSTTCSDLVADEDKIWVEVNTGLDGELECTGLTETSKTGQTLRGYIKLAGGERDIRCTQEIKNKADYIKIINLKLEYDYLESQSTSIRVVHNALEEEE